MLSIIGGSMIKNVLFWFLSEIDKFSYFCYRELQIYLQNLNKFYKVDKRRLKSNR